jgi:hypothetical protein
MHCTVTWDPGAVNDLADIWNQATDRQAVADAADEIDRVLRDFADTVGESLGANRRLRVGPLEVHYTVSPDDCLVCVQKVTRVDDHWVNLLCSNDCANCDLLYKTATQSRTCNPLPMSRSSASKNGSPIYRNTC